MSKKDEEEKVSIDEGKEFVRHTIVGGRPRKRKKVRLNVPVGIEKILYRAAINPAFRAELLADRARALEACAAKLTESESAILKSIPDGSLELMIGTIDPERHGKRRFMKAIAAAVVTIASGTAAATLGGCEPQPEPGDVEVDENISICDPIDIDVDDMVVGGDMPDVPDVVDIRVEEMLVEGAAPDLPDEEDADVEQDEAVADSGDSSGETPDVDDDMQEGGEEEETE